MATIGQFYWPSVGTFVAAYGQFFMAANRGEGKSHKQALIALARRRINVLWAMLRDHTIYQEPMPRITAQAA